jgi:hypothetical protein
LPVARGRHETGDGLARGGSASKSTPPARVTTAEDRNAPLGSAANPLKVSLVSFHGYAPALVANGNDLNTQPGSLYGKEGDQCPLRDPGRHSDAGHHLRIRRRPVRLADLGFLGTGAAQPAQRRPRWQGGDDR